MIIIDLLLTLVIYLIFPIYYKAQYGKTSVKKGKRIALYNSIVGCIIFMIIRALLVGSEYMVGSFAPAVTYYFISKWILIDKNISEDEIVVQNNPYSKDIYKTINTYNDNVSSNTHLVNKNKNLNSDNNSITINIVNDVKYCYNCGSKIKLNAIFCNKCGTDLNERPILNKYCSMCGKRIDDDDIFCPNCGCNMQVKNNTTNVNKKTKSKQNLQKSTSNTSIILKKKTPYRKIEKNQQQSNPIALVDNNTDRRQSIVFTLLIIICIIAIGIGSIIGILFAINPIQFTPEHQPETSSVYFSEEYLELSPKKKIEYITKNEGIFQNGSTDYYDEYSLTIELQTIENFENVDTSITIFYGPRNGEYGFSIENTIYIAEGIGYQSTVLYLKDCEFLSVLSLNEDFSDAFEYVTGTFVTPVHTMNDFSATNYSSLNYVNIGFSNITKLLDNLNKALKPYNISISTFGFYM